MVSRNLWCVTCSGYQPGHDYTFSVMQLEELIALNVGAMVKGPPRIPQGLIYICETESEARASCQLMQDRRDAREARRDI